MADPTLDLHNADWTVMSPNETGLATSLAGLITGLVSLCRNEGMDLNAACAGSLHRGFSPGKRTAPAAHRPRRDLRIYGTAIVSGGRMDRRAFGIRDAA